ncbi:MAG TPA: hypothetical protein VIK07_01585 [Bacteroidales bacterium]
MASKIDLLTRIPYYNNDYSLDLADLLPHNWKAASELSKTPVEHHMLTTQRSAIF